jgi:glycosyltransferase involved in cell wall biosynthesis
MTAPTISVITATYNRSNVLRHSLESLLRSTYVDWELLVIGDACTDNTEDVVGSFGDPRIRFVNLAANFGEQSGPNNEGFKLSRGKYIAYLNHDDLFFSDHLATSLKELESTGADLVYSALVSPAPRAPEELAQGKMRFTLRGASASGKYEPYVFAPASTWLLRRALLESIGPWRPALECIIESSQDLLFRAWKADKRLRFKPHVTVLAVQSGSRKDVYRNRESYESEFYAGQMKNNPSFREEILTRVAIDLAARAAVPKIHCSFGRGLRKLLYRPALRFGWHPRAVRALLKGRGRGATINRLRRIRGLDPLRRRQNGSGERRVPE